MAHVLERLIATSHQRLGHRPVRRGGFTPEDATHVARHALNTITNLAAAQPGVVAGQEAGDIEAARREARAILQSLPADRYPRLVEAAIPLSEGVAPDAYVAFGLDLLIAGIETMADRSS